MKIFALLLFVVGIAAARSQWQWESGKEYVYGYSGRILTGMPELDASHFSGLAINCSVHLQVNSDQYVLFVKNPKYVKVQQRLERSNEENVSAENWRKLRIPEPQGQVSEELVSVLSQPIVFTISDGEIQTAKVSRGEPVWSVNFKKALALQLQTKLDSQRQVNKVQPTSEEEDETYWKVKEETIDGVCESVYQIRELPSYMIVENPELVPYPEACSGNKYYGLTKTRDVAKCEKVSAFTYYKPGYYGYQMSGNNADMWSRSSTTRYIACQSREGKLALQTIINEGELVQDLLGFKVEKFVTGTLQVWHLKTVLETQSEVPMPSDLAPVRSMMYEYLYGFLQHDQQALRNNLNQADRVKLMQEGQIPRNTPNQDKASQQSLPRNFLSGSSSNPQINGEEIRRQVKRLVTEVTRELAENVDIHEKQVTMKILSAARGIGLLPADSFQDELNKLYTELKSEFERSEQDLASMRNIFFDTVLMSGRSQSIVFLKTMILKNNELNKGQISNVFYWMPQYIVTPTKDLLSELFELVTSDKIRECPLLRNAAAMGFSTLVQRACLSPVRKTSYPVAVFGEFCNPESKVITEKWIPYLLRELKDPQTTSSKRNEILVTLGLMSHKTVVTELVAYIEGSVERASEANRIMALYSLANTAYEHQSLTLPIFYSVLSNPAETTELRIGAFNVLIRMNPPMGVMHKIAALTWNEKNLEVLKVINMALATLSNASSQESTVESSMSVARKAALIYPLIKKTPGILPSSAAIFISQHLRKLGVGYDAQINWLTSSGSYLPSSFYTELTYYMEQLRFTPLATGARLENLKTFISELQQLLQVQDQGQERNENVWSGEEQQKNTLKHQLHREWAKVIDELGLKERKTGPLSADFFLRLYETTPMYFNVDGITAKMAREQIDAIVRDPTSIKNKVCGSFPMNYQGTVDLSPSEFLIASDMGFPISIEVRMPLVVSIRGNFDVNCNPVSPSVSLNANAVYASQLIGWIGTINPFDNEYVVTGIDQHSVVNVPIDVSAKVNIISSQLSITVNPKGSGDKPVYLAHHHVRPYTVSKKISDLTPMTLQDNIKYIKSGEEIKKIEASFGEYYGMDLKTQVHTESRYTDLQSSLDVLRLYNYNPINMIMFSRTSPALSDSGKASLRKHEFAVIMNPTSSSTKEILIDLKFGWGKKEQRQEQQFNSYENNRQQQQQQQQQRIQYQTIKMRSDQQENRLQNPYKIQTVDIDQAQGHPIRQQKIKTLLENLNAESGRAITLSWSTTLKGSRTRFWTYTLSAAFGQETEKHHRSGFAKQKWNLQLERGSSSPSSPFNQICVNGELDVPIVPVWNTEQIRSTLINFRYINTLNFGSQSCSESSIRITGNAKVSHEQKEYSRQSEDAEECQRLENVNAPNARFSESCERARRQAQTVDEVEFKIDFNDVPEIVKKVESRLTQFLKVVLWPYLKSDRKPEAHERMESRFCRLKFHRETPTFDLTIERPEEKVSFERIRLPSPLNRIFPLKANQNNVVQAAKQIIGNSVSPVCKVEYTTMTTFDNRSLPFHIDYCFHLLSGDCSSQRKFAILTRTMKPGNRRELMAFLGELMIVMTPSERHHTTVFDFIKISLDGEEINVPANIWTSITYKGKEYGSVYRSSDNVIQVKAPTYSVELQYDGNDIKIFGSPELKSQLCGLCGNIDQENRERMTGPAQCVYSKPELQVASYRVSNGLGCQSNLPRQIQNQLERERDRCIQFEHIPTKISKSLKTQSGSCTVLRHVVVQQQNEVCFSVERVPQCGLDCMPAEVEESKVTKDVQFICLPEGRLAELYTMKANRGQELPELRSMPIKFEGKVQAPRRCNSSRLINNNL